MTIITPVASAKAENHTRMAFPATLGPRAPAFAELPPPLALANVVVVVVELRDELRDEVVVGVVLSPLPPLLLPPPPPKLATAELNDVDPASDSRDVALAGVVGVNVAEMAAKELDASAELVARTVTVSWVVVMLEVTTEASMATE